MPILAIRAPKNGGNDRALGMALCAADRALSHHTLVCASRLAGSSHG